MIRVTQVLDYFAEPGLVDWKIKVGKKEARRISSVATKIGSKVDAIIKGVDRLKASDSIEVRNCIEGFNRWKKEYRVDEKDLKFPERFFDNVEQITGEADCLWKNVLIDFKCAREIRKKYWIQVCKYSQYYDVSEVAILRFDKNTSDYEFKLNKDIGLELSDGILVFDGLASAYRFLKGDDDTSEEEEVANGDDQNSPSNQKVGS